MNFKCAKIYALTMLLFVSSCAVNRVKPVYSPIDAYSMYKVPVIYGVCKDGSEGNQDMSGWSLFSDAFGEFDPALQEGTGGCFGSNDYFPLPLQKEGCKSSMVQYYVMMVPPDEYVYELIRFQDNKKFKSVYFKAEGNEPIYLGNFNAKMVKEDGTYPSYYMPVSSIKYNWEKAKLALEKLGIDSKNLKKANFIPANGAKSVFLCTP